MLQDAAERPSAACKRKGLRNENLIVGHEKQREQREQGKQGKQREEDKDKEKEHAKQQPKQPQRLHLGDSLACSNNNRQVADKNNNYI